MKVCFVLGEVALYAGEEDEEGVISGDVLAGNVHAHCLTEHLVVRQRNVKFSISPSYLFVFLLSVHSFIIVVAKFLTDFVISLHDVFHSYGSC